MRAEKKPGKQRDPFISLTFLQTGICILIAAVLLFTAFYRQESFSRMRTEFDSLNAGDYGKEPLRFFDIGSGYEKKEDQTSEKNEPSSEPDAEPSVSAASAAEQTGTGAALPAAALTPVPLTLNTETPILPVSGSMTSGYGERTHPIYGQTRFHSGVDLGAEEGTPVLAVLDGEVVGVGVGEMSGNYVKLRHTGDRETLYCHLSAVNVKTGETVRKGDVVGFVGHTGLATGPHLHFELHVGGEKTDPTAFLEGASGGTALR